MADEPLKVAENLKAEANVLISDYGLGRVLSSFGDVWYRGSYEMNTMVWPDLDIHMVMVPDPWSVGRFFELGTQLVSLGNVLTRREAFHRGHVSSGWILVHPSPGRRSHQQNTGPGTSLSCRNTRLRLMYAVRNLICPMNMTK